LGHRYYHQGWFEHRLRGGEAEDALATAVSEADYPITVYGEKTVGASSTKRRLKSGMST
jgi:hypothetical protein